MAVERYELTPEHIAEGDEGDCRYCPVGLCLTPILAVCQVKSGRIIYDDPRGVRSRSLYYKPGLAEAINQFDRGRGMRPGTIVLNREAQWADYEPAAENTHADPA
jgi:hypothetical protein